MMNIRMTLATAAFGVMVSATATAAPADKLTTEQVKAIAEEGFIYGLPLVMNYAIMNEYAVDPKSSQFKAPFNQVKNEPRVFTYKDTAVVTANSDTPYSLVWLDLRAEPMVITIPTVTDRYYSVMLNDGHTYNYGYLGSRATGGKGGSYLVAGPDWQGEKPAGIDGLFHSLTPFSLAAFRTQLLDPADMPNVEKIQGQYKTEPLSTFLGKPAPAAATNPNFLPATTAGIKGNFWTYLGAALEYIPQADEDKDIRAKLEQIGVGPGKTFDLKSLSPEHQQAMLEAMKAGDTKIDTYLASGLTDVNGWQLGSLPGDRAHYNGDWLMRAAAAKAGIYGNDADEAVYLFGRLDANGQTIDTSKHNYSITFTKDQMPPVNAFWSVTMYDGKSQLMIKNPIDRYLINTAMVSEMKKDANGAVTIYIQKDSPGKDKEANWLPAPNDTAYLVMRLYWPQPASESLSVLPVGKGTWQMPGIVMVKE
ncbi:cell envelope protein [Oceanisphaera profunda]|uniref:Cell envelope protein n=1 Tax=Oceanisphaera profunda TaxID=1416627 RepID=A0A1Y0D4H9_9GAMM|nr:DUF1254 domain-containing protein [Oceanisphaera profunda]ART82117.1 cell envelope protein [Oceanisphaera profunda]